MISKYWILTGKTLWILLETVAQWANCEANWQFQVSGARLWKGLGEYSCSRPAKYNAAARPAPGSRSRRTGEIPGSNPHGVHCLHCFASWLLWSSRCARHAWYWWSGIHLTDPLGSLPYICKWMKLLIPYYLQLLSLSCGGKWLFSLLIQLVCVLVVPGCLHLGSSESSGEPNARESQATRVGL